MLLETCMWICMCLINAQIALHVLHVCIKFAKVHNSDLTKSEIHVNQFKGSYKRKSNHLSNITSLYYSCFRQVQVVPGILRIWPHYSSISLRQTFQLSQRSLEPKNRKRTKPHKETDQVNKYNKQEDKNENLFPCFIVHLWNAYSHSPALYHIQTHTHIVQTHIDLNIHWNFINKIISQLKSTVTFLSCEVIT